MRSSSFNFDFVGHTKRWLVISGVIMLVSIGSLALRGFNLGLEFKGGTEITIVNAKRGTTVESVKGALGKLRVNEEVVVQQVGDSGFSIQTRHLGQELQKAAVEEVAKVAGVKASAVSVTDVGPKWGKQITGKAIRALVIFLIIVSIFIAVRFEPKMAGCAMLALFHDLIATGGIYSLTGFVVTPATVIAILTILGYSLYDTVIVFDRVKEETTKLSAAGRRTYSDVANESLNHVLIRALNTSLVSLLTVGSLLFVGVYLLGAQTIRELAVALFIGIAIGTYSSIFVATPVLAAWKERESRWASLRARVAARSGESASPRRPVAKVEDDVTEQEPTPVTAGPAGPRRPVGRPQQQRRKKKKRR